LPIYVIHMPLLALLDVLLAGPLSAVEGPLQVVLAVVEPILMTALISWICLLMHRGLEASKLSRFLLDLPGGGKPQQGTGPRRGGGRPGARVHGLPGARGRTGGGRRPPRGEPRRDVRHRGPRRRWRRWPAGRSVADRARRRGRVSAAARPPRARLSGSVPRRAP